MSKWYLNALIISVLCIFAGCKKSTNSDSNESSFTLAEPGNVQTNGSYVIHISSDTSNYLTIPVAVSKPGSWSLQSDSVNGVKFSGSGQFSSTGVQVVKLFAAGTPNSPDKSTFKVKLASREVTASFVPMKSFLDINVNNSKVWGYELFYPLQSTWRSAGVIDAEYPTCQIYNIADPSNNFRLFFEYRDVSFLNATGTEEWDLYSPSKLPIADVSDPNHGFKVTLKNVNSYYELSSDRTVNDDDQYVEIISRATYNVNVLTPTGMGQTPVYVVKIKFSAKVADDLNNQQTISGTTILYFHTVNY